MQDNVIISAENLCKAYRLYEKPLDRLKESLDPWKRRYSKDFYALKDVNFKICRGETIGIVGKNGAGKSTLLKILTGVLTPSAGRVTIKGKISALLELGAGFNPEMTGLENIYLNGTIMGYSREAIDLKIADILEFADIGEFINQPVKMYSSGMFARLAFAVSVNVDPEILIVDEALAVGDKRFQIKCMNKMKKMMEGGTTVLFVSHDSNAIRRFCSRALWFHEGKLMACGETNRVVDQYLEYNNCGVNLMVQNRSNAVKNNIPQQPVNSIAQIIDFRVLNKAGEEIAETDFNEPLTIEVAYRVFDTAIEKPVLGVALYSVDDEYICGLNTLLDNYSIPWQKGENRVRLEYPLGLRTISGRYYFDTALFEETATVSIQYISRVEEITVVSEYVGEGRLIIPHGWSS